VDPLSNAPKFQSKKIKSLVFSAVQSSLIKLGDISRYRTQTPPRTKPPTVVPPDYGPSYGYYNLAQSLLPENGAAANQLAVLSTYSKDYVGSTYYFYRAVACRDKFATAEDNLKVGFRKVVREGEVGGVEREDVGMFVLRFLKMHAEFYAGETYARCVDGADGRDFDDGSVVEMLENLILERAISAKFLNRLTFINMSALYVAQQHDPDSLDFLPTLLSHYSILLRLLSTELSTSSDPDPSAHITPLIRLISPSLRLYSKWLLLHHSLPPTPFWSTYLTSISSLQSLFPVPVAGLTSPLEEDLLAAGFAPLEPDSSRKRHKARTGNRKRGFDKLLLQWGRMGGEKAEAEGGEHPNVEMLGRLKDLLADVMELASIPVRCPAMKGLMIDF
jgi:Est1 DNA/RNA binding domain